MNHCSLIFLHFKFSWLKIQLIIWYVVLSLFKFLFKSYFISLEIWINKHKNQSYPKSRIINAFEQKICSCHCPSDDFPGASHSTFPQSVQLFPSVAGNLFFNKEHNFFYFRTTENQSMTFIVVMVCWRTVLERNSRVYVLSVSNLLIFDRNVEVKRLKELKVFLFYLNEMNCLYIDLVTWGKVYRKARLWI